MFIKTQSRKDLFLLDFLQDIVQCPVLIFKPAFAEFAELPIIINLLHLNKIVFAISYRKTKTSELLLIKPRILESLAL